MSRIGKMPVVVPAGVDVSIKDDQISVKGSGGTLQMTRNALVEIKLDAGKMTFVRKLTLIGVGYKAQAQGAKLNLTVGYSHPVNMDMPAGITVATPTPTEVVIKGADRQRVGQIAAEIRAVRPPEPYKGKGIRYSDEKITIKETKKK
jgi:large subunit ribosomal protein L6